MHAPSGAPAARPAVTERSPLASLLSQPNRLLLVVLALVVAFAWLQLFGAGAAGPSQAHAAHAGLAPAHPHAWGTRDLALALAMWLLMSVAMMLPTAAPAILAYADLMRTRAASAAGRHGGLAIAAFVTGYLLAWSGFALAAAGAQWMMAGAAQRAPGVAARAPLLGGIVVAGAGLYQLSRLKDMCLTRCRSPLGFFFAHWRDGPGGAVALGARHGLHCVGCCWALMCLMLVTGVMNLSWTAVLTILMLLEKVLPAGRTLARAAGVALLAWGGWLIATHMTGGMTP